MKWPLPPMPVFEETCGHITGFQNPKFRVLSEFYCEPSWSRYLFKIILKIIYHPSIIHLSVCLSGWCVLAVMARWRSCVTLWSSELSWMQTPQRNQWNKCCRWGSFLQVRKREDTPTYRSTHSRSTVCVRYDIVLLTFCVSILTGSTDVVSCSVHGVRDPVTAALHIVLGRYLLVWFYMIPPWIIDPNFIITFTGVGSFWSSSTVVIFIVQSS